MDSTRLRQTRSLDILVRKFQRSIFFMCLWNIIGKDLCAKALKPLVELFRGIAQGTYSSFGSDGVLYRLGTLTFSLQVLASCFMTPLLITNHLCFKMTELTKDCSASECSAFHLTSSVDLLLCSLSLTVHQVYFSLLSDISISIICNLLFSLLTFLHISPSLLLCRWRER